ncbi:MAG: hypothetical protein RIC16_17060 [Rhodospirillales bacterium]
MTLRPDDESARLYRRYVRLAVLSAFLICLPAYAFSLRLSAIGTCHPGGYSDDHYLGTCFVDTYGDYDTGALYHDLEGGALDAARNADVLLLGASTALFGFSTDAVDAFFRAQGLTYYVLAFNGEGADFFVEFHKKHRLSPKAVIINNDAFFKAGLGPHGTEVVAGDQTFILELYMKRISQLLHQATCARAPAGWWKICGRKGSLYRSRSTGAVLNDKNLALSGDLIDYDTAGDYGDSGRWQFSDAAFENFRSSIGLPLKCIVTTLVPSTIISFDAAQRKADKLGVPFVMAKLDDVYTQGHLERDSAERWSAIFVERVKPYLDNCLEQTVE